MSDDEDYNPNNENDKASSDDELQFDANRSSRNDHRLVGSCKRYSAVWKFFVPLGDEKAICNQCHVTLSYKSTGNLQKHLKRMHPQCFREYHTLKYTVSPDFQKDSLGVSKVPNWDILSRWFKMSEPGFSNCRVCDHFVNIAHCHTHLRKHPTHYAIYKKLVRGSKSEIKDEQDAPSLTEDNTDTDKSPSNPGFKLSASNNEIIIEQIEDDTARNMTSPWDFFKNMDSPSGATCRLCEAVVSWSDDVTNLRRHLDQEHVGLELDDEEIIENTDTTNLDSNLESQTEPQRPKKRKKKKNSNTWRNSNNSNSLRNSNSLNDEQYEESLERFGAYVTSLMRLLPRETAAKYQVQIIERLVKETSGL